MEIAFTVNKRGRLMAYRCDLRQMRYFRISVEKAHKLLAEKEATVCDYHPFTKPTWHLTKPETFTPVA